MAVNQARTNHSKGTRERKKVSIYNKYGEKLVGVLHETGSRELVIICHGFRSTKDRIPMVNLANAFEKEGISAFRFDFAGNGESEGSFQYGNYWREADDLLSVVQHFQGEKRFVAALIGHSKGGNAVLLYASRNNNVKFIVNIAGRFNLERGIDGRLGKDYLEKIEQNGFIDVKSRRASLYNYKGKAVFNRLSGAQLDWEYTRYTDVDVHVMCVWSDVGKIEYRVTKESLMDRLETDTRAACETIDRTCSVLTIHSTLDEMVPVNDAMEFSKHIPNHKLHIFEGADHDFTSHQDELASIVLDFAKSGLPAHGEAVKLVRSRL